MYMQHICNLPNVAFTTLVHDPDVTSDQELILAEQVETVCPASFHLYPSRDTHHSRSRKVAYALTCAFVCTMG